jgi:hypothetical protein
MSTTRVGILDENKEYFWKTVNGVRAKVGPGWRNVSIGYAKVNGEWKEIFVRPGPTVRSFRLDPITNDSVTFKWHAGPNVEKTELWVASREAGSGSNLSYEKALEINSVYTTPASQKIILQQGSATITGIGTSFTSLVPENIIYTQLDGVRTLVGTVKSVESNTSLTLKSEWTGISSADPVAGNVFIYQSNNSYLYNTNRETEYFFYLIPIELVGSERIPGDKSNTIQRITPVGPPPPITDLSFIENDGKTGKFILGWTPSPRYKTDSYVYYNNGGSTTTNNTTAVQTFSSLTGSWNGAPQITGAGKRYAIQIQAFNSLGEGSGKSNTIFYNYTPIISQTLKSPTISGSFLPRTGNTSNWNRITVSWTSDPVNHDYYQLWAKPTSSSNASYQLIQTVQSNPTDTPGGTKTAAYSGPNQNTRYDVKIITYANSPKPGYSWSATPGTSVSSNVITFKTGQPQITRTDTGNDIKYINGTRSSMQVTSVFRGTTSLGTSITYTNNGYVGRTSSTSAPTYGVTKITITERRTKPARANWNNQPWSRESLVPDTYVSANCTNSDSGWGLITNTSTLQRRRRVTYSCNPLPRTTTTTTYTTEFDFSASAIKLGGGQSLDSSRLTISANRSGAVNVNVGGTNYEENGSVSITRDNIYNKLIVPSNRVRLTRSTDPIIVYSNGVVRVDYSYSYTTTTQTFSPPALV